MSIKFFVFICSISSLFDYSNSHIRANFITDRRIKRIIGDDIVESSKIMLRKDSIKNQKSEKFIWDKHFPRPFFYILEAEVSLKPNIDFSMLLKCFSIKEEEIYQIEINKKSQKIIFNDKNNNVAHIGSQDDINNEFFMSNHERGIESIMNSVVYMNNIEFISDHYSTLCKYFDVFLGEI